MFALFASLPPMPAPRRTSLIVRIAQHFRRPR